MHFGFFFFFFLFSLCGRPSDKAIYVARKLNFILAINHISIFHWSVNYGDYFDLTQITQYQIKDQLNAFKRSSTKLKYNVKVRNQISILPHFFFSFWLSRHHMFLLTLKALWLHKRLHWTCCFIDCFYKDCVALEELYLNHNGIANMEGLSSLVNLRVLDVSSNKLTQVNNIQNLLLVQKRIIWYLKTLLRLLLVQTRSSPLST